MWCFFQNANYIFYFYFHNASVKGGKIMETNISTVQVVLMGLITVFVVLICLIVIIKILGLIMEKVAKKQPAPAAAPAPAPVAAPAGAGEQVKSPMPGNILSVNVNVGDTVAEGQVLMILEAMKMGS